MSVILLSSPRVEVSDGGTVAAMYATSIEVKEGESQEIGVKCVDFVER